MAAVVEADLWAADGLRLPSGLCQDWAGVHWPTTVITSRSVREWKARWLSMSEGRGFWGWLIRFVRGWLWPPKIQPYSGDLGFPTLDLNALRADLDVDRMAAENGAAGVPNQAQTQPDGQEQKIHHAIHQRVLEAKGKRIQLADRIRASIEARQLAPDVKRCDDIPGDFSRELKNRGYSLDGELDAQGSKLKNLKQEVDEYRQTHGITRSPKLYEEEERNRALVALMVLTVVQLVANAFLFGQGSLYGLSFGLLLALGLAFFDIGLHFKFGRQAARLKAPDRVNRVVGYSASAGSLVSVLAFNLGMVHLRLVTRESGAKGWENWLPSLTNDPFGFTDFLSWALLAVGLFCSVLAFVAGWLWDEPIPIFRRNGSLIIRLQDDIQELREERRNLKSSLLKRFLLELDGIDKKAEHHVTIISDSVSRIRQAEEAFRDYCDDANKIFAALVGLYRDENRKARSTPAPPFFDSPASLAFDRHPPSSDEDFDAVVRQATQDRTELRAKLPMARSKLRSLADDAVEFPE